VLAVVAAAAERLTALAEAFLIGLGRPNY